jgi:hypothetical protein
LYIKTSNAYPIKYAIIKNTKYAMNVLEEYLNELVFGKYELKIVLYKIINKIVATATVSPA